MKHPASGSLPLPGLRWRGLNLQLFLLIFLPVTLLLLIITLGSLTMHQRAMRTLVGERDERAAHITATAISEQLNHRGAAIQGLALRAINQTSLQAILSTSKFLDLDFDGGLAFFAQDGELLAASSDPAFWASFKNEITQLLAEIQYQTDSQAVFSAVSSDPSEEGAIVFVAAAAEKNGPVAVGAFSPVTMTRRTLASAFAPGEQSNAFVVDPNHRLIYQAGDFSTPESPQSHPGVAEALRGETGTTYIKVDGSEHVVSFSPILPTGWALVIEEPWEVVANPLLNTTQLAPLVLVPVLLLSLVALWFGARQIVQPLQELEARSADLAWGKYDSITSPVGGIEEITHLQTTLIYLSQKIQSAQAGLHSYIEAITTGQEDERQRLARELHDDTIQDLIALNQRVQLAQLKLAADPQAQTALEEIQALTEDTIQDLRRVIRALRPLYLEDLGLVASLQMLARETAESAGIPIDFAYSGVEERLSPKTELALYRIAQEGLSNMQRHAKASKASLSIAYDSAQIQLNITDNGCGFDIPESPAEFASNGHFGLLGIYERTELIGASVSVKTAPGSGTQIIVRLMILAALENQ